MLIHSVAHHLILACLELLHNNLLFIADEHGKVRLDGTSVVLTPLVEGFHSQSVDVVQGSGFMETHGGVSATVARVAGLVQGHPARLNGGRHNRGGSGLGSLRGQVRVRLRSDGSLSCKQSFLLLSDRSGHF